MPSGVGLTSSPPPVSNPLSDFRKNPSRAIFVTGEIDEKLIHRLTPDICRLRAECAEPITAYIDSRGGSTLAADHLFALLKTPTQDGNVTVATTRAASAAADILALGDYAIAYPHAVVHFHGTPIVCRRNHEGIRARFGCIFARSQRRVRPAFGKAGFRNLINIPCKIYSRDASVFCRHDKLSRVGC